ncbi:unnamed protein product [Amoebophrya sp. A25]|nr:unnamed protein product [Amoebophrya sp. A25]|eukprot:GSA25T00003902001.1
MKQRYKSQSLRRKAFALSGVIHVADGLQRERKDADHDPNLRGAAYQYHDRTNNSLSPQGKRSNSPGGISSPMRAVAREKPRLRGSAASLATADVSDAYADPDETCFLEFGDSSSCGRNSDSSQGLKTAEDGLMQEQSSTSTTGRAPGGDNANAAEDAENQDQAAPPAAGLVSSPGEAKVETKAGEGHVAASAVATSAEKGARLAAAPAASASPSSTTPSEEATLNSKQQDQGEQQEAGGVDGTDGKLSKLKAKADEERREETSSAGVARGDIAEAGDREQVNSQVEQLHLERDPASGSASETTSAQGGAQEVEGQQEAGGKALAASSSVGSGSGTSAQDEQLAATRLQHEGEGQTTAAEDCTWPTASAPKVAGTMGVSWPGFARDPAWFGWYTKFRNCEALPESLPAKRQVFPIDHSKLKCVPRKTSDGWKDVACKLDWPAEGSDRESKPYMLWDIGSFAICTPRGEIVEQVWVDKQPSSCDEMTMAWLSQHAVRKWGEPFGLQETTSEGAEPLWRTEKSDKTPSVRLRYSWEGFHRFSNDETWEKALQVYSKENYKCCEPAPAAVAP